jgi:hypothetical protein
MPADPLSPRSPRRREGPSISLCRAFLSVAGLSSFDGDGSTSLIACYSEMAPRRVWSSVRISCDLPSLLYRFPESMLVASEKEYRSVVGRVHPCCDIDFIISIDFECATSNLQDP